MYDITDNNCPRLIDKDLFFEIGCFNTNLTGFEDWELNNKIKKKIIKFYISKKKLTIMRKRLRSLKLPKKSLLSF